MRDVAVEFYRACKPHLEPDFSASISDDLFGGEFLFAVDELVYELVGDGLVFDKELMSRVLAVFEPEAQRHAHDRFVRDDFLENLKTMVDNAQ